MTRGFIWRPGCVGQGGDAAGCGDGLDGRRGPIPCAADIAGRAGHEVAVERILHDSAWPAETSARATWGRPSASIPPGTSGRWSSHGDAEAPAAARAFARGVVAGRRAAVARVRREGVRRSGPRPGRACAARRGAPRYRRRPRPRSSTMVLISTPTMMRGPVVPRRADSRRPAARVAPASVSWSVIATRVEPQARICS